MADDVYARFLDFVARRQAPQEFAEGGQISDEEYDRRLLSRMKRDTGRVTEPTPAEQREAFASAGRDAAQLAADVLLPQSPLDAALMVALGPGGRLVRLPVAAALAAAEPTEAEASRLRRLAERLATPSISDQPSRPITERVTRSIMPAPQRFFDPEDKAYKPFLQDFEPTPGGRYLEMRRGEAPRDVTGESVDAARIAVTPEGRPVMQVGEPTSLPTGSPGRGSSTTKTNLFKRSAGWKWTNAPAGYEDAPTLVSVENRGQHYYALAAEYPKGVDLARYPTAPSEPRLRPTTQGNVELGNQVGTITVRGKEHPVYDVLTVRQLAPVAAAGSGAALASDE
jgi:hypothetical protein